MKDFYGVYQIILSRRLAIEAAREALRSTFTHRKTPIQLIELDTQGLQRNWERFLFKGKLVAPDLNTVIDEINHFLLDNHLQG